MSGTRDTIDPAVREMREREGWRSIGAWTFHAPIAAGYEGVCVSFEAVRIADHWHVHVCSGRHVRQPDGIPVHEGRGLRTGFAGKLILRPLEWLLLREILDRDERVAIYEVEHPTPGQARRYAESRS